MKYNEVLVLGLAPPFCLIKHFINTSFLLGIGANLEGSWTLGVWKLDADAESLRQPWLDECLWGWRGCWWDGSGYYCQGLRMGGFLHKSVKSLLADNPGSFKIIHRHCCISKPSSALEFRCVWRVNIPLPSVLGEREYFNPLLEDVRMSGALFIYLNLWRIPLFHHLFDSEITFSQWKQAANINIF